jgi:hypothetical protein
VTRRGLVNISESLSGASKCAKWFLYTWAHLLLFSDAGRKDQRGEVTLPGSHSRELAEACLSMQVTTA